MMKLDLRRLRQQGAAIAGAHRADTRPLVLLFCGVIAVLSLGSNGLSLYLSEQIGGTGGLGGMGLRSVLQTAQEVLNLVNILFGPFWSAGFLFAMMAMVRGRTPEKRDLTEGFRRFPRILGWLAFEFLLVLALLMSAVNLAGLIFSFTEQGAAFAMELAPILSDPSIFAADGTLNLELLPMELMAPAALTLTLLTMAVFLPMYAFVSYGFRMSLYLVLDQPIGAVRAHFVSAQLLRGHKWELVKLDLSFWWYYLLLAAVSVVGYLDMVLELLGIAVPIDPMVMFFGTLAAYCVLYTLLCLWKKCPVDAAYVLAYESILHPEEEPEAV